MLETSRTFACLLFQEFYLEPSVLHSVKKKRKIHIFFRQISLGYSSFFSYKGGFTKFLPQITVCGKVRNSILINLFREINSLYYFKFSRKRVAHAFTKFFSRVMWNWFHAKFCSLSLTRKTKYFHDCIQASCGIQRFHKIVGYLLTPREKH